MSRLVSSDGSCSVGLVDHDKITFEHKELNGEKNIWWPLDEVAALIEHLKEIEEDGCPCEACGWERKERAEGEWYEKRLSGRGDKEAT